MLQGQRDVYLLLIDFWNQAVRDSRAARKFAQRHARLRAVIGRIIEGATRDQGLQLTHPREQVATALLALFNGFTIERLADPKSASDEILAHATAAIIKGFAKRRERRGTRRK